MKFDIDFFRKISSSYGINNCQQQRIINLSKQISNQYNNTVNGFIGLVESVRGTDCYINEPLYKYRIAINKQTRILIDYNRNMTKTDTSPFVREVKAYFNTFKSGDYVTYINIATKKEDTFLINTSIVNELHNDKYFMELCNNFISWIDKRGDIYTIPCIISTDSSMNTINYQEINTLKRNKKVTIPNNILTKDFFVDMEFIFDHKDKYKIIGIDRNTVQGVMNLILINSGINKDVDNLNLNIANYNILKNNYSIKILTDNQESFSINENTTKKLNIELINNDKKIDLSDKNNEYLFNKIICKSSDNNIAQLYIENNSLMIKALDIGECEVSISIQNIKGLKESVVSKKYCVSVIKDNPINNYTIEVSDVNGDFSVRPSLDNTFSAVLKSNGEILKDTMFSFNIKNKDTTSSTLLGKIISTTNNSCTIKYNSYKKYGILILIIKDISGLVTKEIEIPVKKITDL